MREYVDCSVFGGVGAGHRVAGCRSGRGRRPAPSGSRRRSEVKIDNFTFRTAELTVTAGTTVTWTNRDDIPHTVVSTDKVFKSKVLDTDEKFSYTFSKPGTYPVLLFDPPEDDRQGRGAVRGNAYESVRNQDRVLAKHAQHVVLIHFPIALFIAAVAFDYLAHWTKSRDTGGRGVLQSAPRCGLDGASRGDRFCGLAMGA